MALNALHGAQAVVGYGPYLELIDPALLEGKIVLSSPMKKEMERATKAIDCALSGQNTVVVSSGDSGIYGMAGLILEFMERQSLLDSIDLEIVPGIPALCAAAALLGAPLMHDFAAISLSDLLTPLPLIMKRVRCAAEGDFVIVLYNPKSRRRASYLKEALSIIAEHRQSHTPVGFVRNAYRPGQETRIATLGSCTAEDADMLTTVVVGNSATRIAGRHMLTPRGYFEKYGKHSSHNNE